jgi:hypothetical protein
MGGCAAHTGQPVPTWISGASGDLIDEYWSHTRRVRALAEKTFNEHRLYITWFLEDLKKRKIALHGVALAEVDRFVSTLTTERKLAVTSAANACICIRHFLRFLYRTKRLSTDLAPAAIGPTLRQRLKRLPEGHVAWEDRDFPTLALDVTYVLFLKYIPQSTAYRPISQFSTLRDDNANLTIARPSYRIVLPGFTVAGIGPTVASWLTSCEYVQSLPGR